MTKQLFDTGSLKSKRQMTDSSPSVLGSLWQTCPAPPVKSPVDGAASPSKSRIVALSAAKGAEPNSLHCRWPHPWWPPTQLWRRRHRAPPHLAPGMRCRVPEKQPHLLKEQTRSLPMAVPSRDNTSQRARKFIHTVFHS